MCYDITESIKAIARLFADDCIIYKTITDQEDEVSFQQDLNNLVTWADTWGMKFNASKCNVMRISRRKNPGTTNYKMMGEKLQEVKEHQYLGVHIEDNLKWNKQAKFAAAKATKVLNFIRRNFYNCSKGVKEKLYQTLVRPHLEYGSVTCNPITDKNNKLLEMVQRRAARFVLGDYGRYSSVLNWDTLELRREKQRLSTFHKIFQGTIGLDIDKYATKKFDRPRRTNDQQYNVKSNFISTTQFSESFFPLTISAWNQLPQSIVNSPTTDDFKTAVDDMYTARQQLNHSRQPCVTLPRGGLRGKLLQGTRYNKT